MRRLIIFMALLQLVRRLKGMLETEIGPIVVFGLLAAMTSLHLEVVHMPHHQNSLKCSHILEIVSRN
jgi:hypothetical protein